MKLSPSDVRSGVVAFICIFIFDLIKGTLGLYGLLFVACMSRFNVDRKSASFPFLLCVTVKHATGPVVGFLGSKFGSKNTILLGILLSSIAVAACFFAEDIVGITVLWGAVFGFSGGMSISLLPEVLSKHFSKHLDKAMGIFVGSECVSVMLLTLLANYLLKTYGLSGTFLILSAVLLHSVPAAMLINVPRNSDKSSKPSKILSPLTEKLLHDGKQDTFEEEPVSDIRKHELKINENHQYVVHNTTTFSPVPRKESSNQKSSLSKFKVFLDPTYILILITQSMMMYLWTSVDIILMDVSLDHGVSADEAVHMIVGFQAAEAVGRFTVGFVTELGCLSKAHFQALFSFVIGGLLFSIMWVQGFATMMAFTLVLGYFSGGLAVISISFVMHYVDKDCYKMAIPSRYLLYPLISLTQSPLIGYFRDTLRSYNGYLCVLIGICCTNCVISLLTPPFVKFREKRTGKHVSKHELNLV